MSEFQVARRATVWVLSLDSGGCGACVQSIQALQAPRYAGALRARGISFALGPRHADVVLLTGALTEVSRPAVLRTLADVPQPRAIVAVGNCATDGCVFQGSACVSASAAEALEAHVEIGGCPPEPEAILAAISQAVELLADVTVADEPVEGERAGAIAGEAETVDAPVVAREEGNEP